MKIRQDHTRFREIVRGHVKRELRRHMSSSEILGSQGGKSVKIPISRIDIPRFRLGSAQGQGGVGQGDGDVGDPVAGDPGDESGQGPAGSGEGNKELELEVTIEELAQLMGEQLELPRIEPRGGTDVSSSSVRYTGVRPVGPESLRSFKRTYREALQRMVASGDYDPNNPVVVPRREDRRYRAWDVVPKPVTQAAIIYMMDVSGSMGDEQKEIVRIESFWIDTWLRSQYAGIESRYIIHDSTAREVDRETFFHTRESGGTMISSAYTTCVEIIDADYASSEWNIYPFHFSDGDNWSVDDTAHCMNLLRDRILPRANMFAYGQVDSPYGSGQFLKDLQRVLADDPKVVLSEIKGRDRIYDSIKDFLGRGL
ncbi:MAG: DUF444 family protein [Myxococcales bacterium]|nr:DUF444 family protein [Myxococcales bacterium]MCB9533769.1 DUF444 family protein [Myxococcales bacterium]